MRRNRNGAGKNHRPPGPLRAVGCCAAVMLAIMLLMARMATLYSDGGAYPKTEHAGTNSNTNAVTGVSRTDDNPVVGYTIDKFADGDCVHCHDEHASYNKTTHTTQDYMLYLATGNAFCYDCHTSQTTTGGSLSYPAWPGNAVYNLSGHGTNANTVWPGANPPARKAAEAGRCINCHDPHGRTFLVTGDDNTAPQRAMLTTDLVLNMTTRVEENLCLNCHKLGGPAGAENVASQFALGANVSPTFYNHPISRTSAANDQTPSDHNILEDKILYAAATLPTQTQRHVECVDCHNPHYAGYSGVGGSDAHNYTAPTNVASKVLYGVWGVKILGVAQAGQSTPGNWPAAPAPAAGANNLPAAPTFELIKIDETATFYEWQLCLRCHSSYSWFDNSWAAPNTLTDVSREVNPNNLAHHALVAKGNNQLTTATAQAKATYKGAYRFSPGTDPINATIYCSDCHTSSNTGDPEGPHGSNRPWLVGSFCETNAAYLQGTAAPNCATPTVTYICYKCHRFDVYGNSQYLAGSYGSRNQNHDANGANHGTATDNGWGISCLTCHGGGEPGGIHGTNRGRGSVAGTTNKGEHFMNGACLESFLYDTGATKMTCYTVATGGNTPYCASAGTCDGQHTGGKTDNANYNY